MSDFAVFEKAEDEYQAKFDNIKIPFESRVVVNVSLLKFRNVSVGYYSDLVDTPDPRFTVFCPKILDESVNKFQTRYIPNNVTSGEINQTFKFVVPKDIDSSEEFPIVIELFDVDIAFDDWIGSQTVEASKLEIDGKPLRTTLTFGNNNGELDVIIQRQKRTSSDFRMSLGLCDEEKAFRKKRIPIAYEAIRRIIGDKHGPQNLKETPIVSLVGSGGGYRAVTGMCGAMEALKDAGLLDIFTYACGLSGSGWYLSTAYSRQGVSPDAQEALHEGIKERFCCNLLWELVNPSTILEYQKFVDNTFEKHDQPHTFVNYFPGFLVGRQLLVEKAETCLSEVAPYVDDGKVPYPLIVALHVKDNIKASQYHAYIERSPHEISLPSYAVAMKPDQEGSTWCSGFLARTSPEYPLNFSLGMIGCAFSILLNVALGGGEKKKNLLKFIEDERLRGKDKAHKDLDETERVAEIESDDETDDDDEEEEEEASWISPNSDGALATAAMAAFSTSAPVSIPKSEDNSKIALLMRSIPIFTSRNALIGRTARVKNFALGLNNVKRFPLNPIGKSDVNPGSQKLIDTLGYRSLQRKISKTKPVISFADAGILKNVPTDSVLRPQRATDLMFVMDFNDYGSDDKLDYQPLLAAAAHAWQSGIKFPNIDFQTITNLPPKEFLMFPGDDEGCPTVLWFILNNKTFRNLRNYVPRSQEKPPSDDSRAFNDFDVYGENSFCSSFTFHYSKYNFDQIRELMYYNVSSHIEEIKAALVEVTARKHARYAKHAGTPA